MIKSDPAFLTGQLLVAMPGIGDPRFERAVILVCAHDPEHAMGLVLNRPVEGLTVRRLLRKLGVEAGEAPRDLVLMGGPVEKERGFVLHTAEFSSEPGSIQISDDLLLTATKDVLRAIASPNDRPRKAILTLGNAGWGAGQLEDEIRENVWLACEGDEDLIFDDDHEHKWSRALAKIGIAPEHLSSAAGRA